MSDGIGFLVVMLFASYGLVFFLLIYVIVLHVKLNRAKATIAKMSDSGYLKALIDAVRQLRYETDQT